MNRTSDNLFDGADGDSFDLSALDADERKLVRDLVSFANQHPDARTAEFRNYYIRRVGDFYEARGLSRTEVTKTTVWQIAQHIAGRLMVASGTARDSDDYREKLDAIIRDRFGSRRSFC